MVSSRSWKNSNFQRKLSLALCTGVAFLFLVGSASAGTLASAPTTFAHEIALSTTSLTFAPQVYSMGISRLAGNAMIFRYTLSSGTFGTTPVLTYTPTAGGAVTVTFRSGGAGSATVEYDVAVTTTTAVTDTFTLSAGAAPSGVKFPASSAVGASISITVDVRDLFGPLDTVGTFTRTLATLGAAATLTAATDNGTVIDATIIPPRTAFVVANDDAALVAKASVTATKTITGTKNAAGAVDYTLVAGDVVTFTITGNFTGISQVGFDLDGNGAISTTAGTATIEAFTINSSLTSATLIVDGNRLPDVPRAIFFTKTASAALDPRTFGIAESIAPAAGTTQNRDVATANSGWYVWTQNGTTLYAPYISFSPSNPTKFRFTNASTSDVTVNIALVLDQGTFTQNVSSFTIPAGGSKQITLSETPAAGTLEIGPIATITGGVQPIRGKLTFTALSNTSNVLGMVLFFNPASGTTSQYQMPQIPSLP